MKRKKPKLHAKRLLQPEFVRKAGPHKDKRKRSRKDAIRREIDESEG